MKPKSSRKRAAAVDPQREHYQQVIARIRSSVRRHVPRGAVVAVVAKGDESLLDLGGPLARHLSADASGEYLGYHPSCDLAAIARLEAARARGADFLLLPQTSLWWLEHYAGLRRHLESRYRRVFRRDDTGALFDLRRVRATAAPRPRRAKGSARPAVSILLVGSRRARHSEADVRALLESTGPGEAVEYVAANHALAPGALRLLGKKPGCVLRQQGRGGWAETCNRAAEAARGELLILLAPGVIPLPGWLKAVRDTFAECPQAMVATGRMLAADGTLWSAGNVLFQDGAVHRAGHGDTELLEPAYERRRVTDAAPLALLAVRRECFVQEKGFQRELGDGDLAAADLCLRLHGRGGQTIYAPSCLAVQTDGTSASEDPQAARTFVLRWASLLRRQPARAVAWTAESWRCLLSAQQPAAVPLPAAEAGAASHGRHEAAYQRALATARGETGADFVELDESADPVENAPVRLVAFYLPQYHAIPENDRWWGRGFTEWTNVSKAVPQFEGHYQPHLPGELGFYDLRVPDVRRRQVELARRFGIGAFCFYHYWFAGRRLLERPLDEFMADPEIDFPFCVCWANENWTRRWDGRAEDILMAQDHSQQSDEQFIRDLAPTLRHRNYLRIQGRPVLLVYRVRMLPDPAETARRWRAYCRAEGLGDPYLVATQAFERIDPREIGFDAAVEFPPNTPGERVDLAGEVRRLNPQYAGHVYRYADLARFTCGSPPPPYPLFRTVCPSWDNEARSPGRGAVYAGSSPAGYGEWLAEACRLTLAQRDPEKRLVFINAWNEWAEGTHLEPDRRYGYAYLQKTSDTLRALPCGLDAIPRSWTLLVVSHDANRGGAQRVLLDLLRWLRAHTAIRVKVLCLGEGEWLPEFRALADTALWSELRAGAEASAQGERDALESFCGGRPDLVYANTVAAGRAFDLLAQLGAPIVTHFHELEMSIRRYGGDWIDSICRQTTHFVACAEPVRRNLVEQHAVSPERATTIHASITPRADGGPVTASQRRSLRIRLGLPVTPHLLVGCGVGMPWRKGADLFIAVARRLRAAGLTGFQCLWIGEFAADDVDPALGAWGDQLASLTPEERTYIRFLGVKDDPRPYLQAADLFLLPSREDPFPLVALEAAEAGLPVICFEGVGGMPDFVGQDAGCTVPAGDVGAMARAAAQLLRDRSVRRRLGEQARARLLSQYTVEQTAPTILSLARRIARRAPAVSVIVPNYNHARYLPARLDSIFAQTFRDFEVILLDDASTDGSREILAACADRADVRLVINDANSGSTFRQWMKGLDLARGGLVWIAESDDTCDPRFLESLLPVFADPAVKLAYADSQIIDARGRAAGDYTSGEYLRSLSATKWTRSHRTPAEREISEALGVKNTILSASAVVFRKFELVPALRAQLETMRIAGDWLFFIHAIAGGDVWFDSRKLSQHRRHRRSVVGQLLEQNRVRDFFREFHLVQREIFRRYALDPAFAARWEYYLRGQWNSFFPGRAFDEIVEYYPIDEARAALAAATRA